MGFPVKIIHQIIICQSELIHTYQKLNNSFFIWRFIILFGTGQTSNEKKNILKRTFSPGTRRRRQDDRLIKVSVKYLSKYDTTTIAGYPCEVVLIWPREFLVMVMFFSQGNWLRPIDTLSAYCHCELFCLFCCEEDEPYQSQQTIQNPWDIFHYTSFYRSILFSPLQNKSKKPEGNSILNFKNK